MIKHFLTGFLIGLFLAVNPRYIVPVLMAVSMFYLCKIIYIYIKHGVIKL